MNTSAVIFSVQQKEERKYNVQPLNVMIHHIKDRSSAISKLTDNTPPISIIKV